MVFNLLVKIIRFYSHSRRHRKSGDLVPSVGRFLRFFIENNVILGIYGLKFLKHSRLFSVNGGPQKGYSAIGGFGAV